MTSFSRGDSVLVKFVFADEKGDRKGRREAILAAITSNVGRLLEGDYKIKAWRDAGLLHPSIVTAIVRTVKHEMIADRMGELPPSELRAVEDKLREVLAL